jgi:hypothetical protein
LTSSHGGGAAVAEAAASIVHRTRAGWRIEVRPFCLFEDRDDSGSIPPERPGRVMRLGEGGNL